MENRPYKTSDLGKATYLCTLGFTLLGCTPSDEAGRLNFVFVDDPKFAGTRDFTDAVLEAIELYDTGRAMVSAKHFHTRSRICKKALQNPVDL